jgi:hypothetical protein
MNATKTALVSYETSVFTYMSSKLLYLLNESRDSLMELLAKILERNKKYICRSLINYC